MTFNDKVNNSETLWKKKKKIPKKNSTHKSNLHVLMTKVSFLIYVKWTSSFAPGDTFTMSFLARSVQMLLTGKWNCHSTNNEAFQ